MAIGKHTRASRPVVTTAEIEAVVREVRRLTRPRKGGPPMGGRKKKAKPPEAAK